VELPPQGKGALSEIRVMVAHTDRELCGTIRSIVEHAGMQCLVGHDGETVLKMMDATPPHVVVVDVALQGLYAFEVVDKVRRRPGLGGVKIVLLSSVYNRMAYKRAPSSLYGADDYIEKHHIPDDLILKINRLVVGAAPATVPVPQEEERAGKILSKREAAEQSLAYIHQINEKIQSAEDRQVGGDGEISDSERARRLARIIVSDIALYYQERVDEGIRGGNWAELLATEIQEARKLFRERFPDERIQQAKILEAAFIDLLERRRSELNL
jgi:DNA-binding response OmpR family regulator